MDGCEDTPGWTNGDRPGGALVCADYVARGHCAGGQVLTSWAAGASFNHPQKHCCACGKWDREAAFWRASQSSGRASRAGEPCWDARLDDPMLPWGGSSWCAEWPSVPALDAAAQQLVRKAVRKAIAPFGTIKSRDVRAVLQLRCAQKLCMRVQIISGELWVVAPDSEECPPGSSSSSPCSTAARDRTPGIPTGWWPLWNPTNLQWHFFAGLNLSDCSGLVRPGDYNGPYTRLRMLNALRLLEEAARRAQDTEFVLCVSEVPVNAGGWCLKGPQPVFSSTGNEEHPVIPFVHWMPRLRDWDLSVWDDVRAAQKREAERWESTRPEPPRAAAVFRGGVYRTSVYSREWRTRGVQRSELTPRNWRCCGRFALLRSKEAEASERRKGQPLLDVNLAGRQWPGRLQVGNATLALLDEPQGIPLRSQMYRYRYAINVEGHGGWADRLYHLLLSPQLVFAQDLPMRTWYEQAGLEHGVTHIAVDSGLRNLTASVRLARARGKEPARRMVARAQQVVLPLSLVRTRTASPNPNPNHNPNPGSSGAHVHRWHTTVRAGAIAAL